MRLATSGCACVGEHDPGRRGGSCSAARARDTASAGMGVGVTSKRFQLTWRNTLLLFCSLGAVAAFFAFAGAASAMRDVASATPSVVSDQADYNPGATVTLTGTDWGGSEIVHVTVNDDVGQTWAYNTDVTADDAGNFTLRFQLPNTFVANYRVTAIGSSGATAQTTFTDSQPQT